MRPPPGPWAIAAAAAIAAVALWLLPAPAMAAARTTEDSNALIMTAEIALQRDDCGRAAANYTIAAQRLADTKLAARASEVALDCGQFQAAERAAARWRTLTPNDPGPVHAAMRAELGLYKIDDARSDFQDWIKSGGLANARAAGNDDTGTAGVAEAVRQLAQESGVPATLAMLRGVQDRALQSGASQLELADLALDGWNYREAIQYGEQALSGGAAVAPTQLLLARAHAGLGEADQAVAAASAAHNAAPKEQSFASADVLMLLGREREARTALEALRDNPAQHMQAQRRLGLLAFNRGDYEEAQRDFSELLGDKDSSAVAVYYLAAIAERRDDVGTALRGYQLLAGTALDGAARDRAATLLYKQGQRDEALQSAAAGQRCDADGKADGRDRAGAAALERRRGRPGAGAHRRCAGTLSGASGPALPEGHSAREGRPHRCGGRSARSALPRSTRRTVRLPTRWVSFWPTTTGSWGVPNG